MGPVRLADEVAREVRHRLAGIRAEPAAARMLVEHGGGISAAQEAPPGVQHLLQRGIHALVEERRHARRRTHRPVEYRVDGAADQTGLIELGRVRHDGIQQLQHVLIVAHLRPATRILVVGWPPRHLREHLTEQHEDPGIRFDQVAEIRDDRVQILRLGVRLRAHRREPFLEEGLVGRQPFGHTKRHLRAWVGVHLSCTPCGHGSKYNHFNHLTTGWPGCPSAHRQHGRPTIRDPEPCHRNFPPFAWLAELAGWRHGWR